MNAFGKLSTGLLITLALISGGCKRRVVPPADTETLAALQDYQPIPTLDDQGRVIKLKLEGAQVQDHALELVKALTELKDLSLYGASITDQGLTHLSNARQLEALGLGKTKITGRGLDHLTRLPALRWVWVTENKSLTQADFDKFKAKAVPGITVFQ